MGGRRCPLCDIEVGDVWKLRRHLASIHKKGKNAKKISCSKCSLSFSDSWKARRHEMSHDAKASKPKWYQCDLCPKKFESPSKLARHKVVHQKTDETTCKECNKSFEDASKLRRHLQIHGPNYDCEKCGVRYKCPFQMERHSCASGDYSCGECPAKFGDDFALARHEENQHAGPSNRVNDSQKKAQKRANNTPKTARKLQKVGEKIHEYETDIQREVARNWNQINDFEKEGRKVLDQYNIRLNKFDVDIIENKISEIYAKQGRAFKVRVMGAGVLKKRHDENETEEDPMGATRYLYASTNTSLLPEPTLIGNRDELREFFQNLRNVDIDTVLLANRPSTKYYLRQITNFTIDIYKLKDHAIGSLVDGTASVEVYLQGNRSVRSFFGSKDNLCFFRCLAFHQLRAKRVKNEEASVRVHRLEKRTVELFKQWCDFRQKNPPKKATCRPVAYDCKPGDFSGVTLGDIPELERCFETNARIFCLIANSAVEEEEEGETESQEMQVKDEYSAYTLQDTMGRYKDTMHLNLNRDHFSYIANRDGYCKSRRCQWCMRYFQRSNHLNAHHKICKGSKTRHFYPGGGYGNRPTLFQRLELHGIRVDKERRYFPHRAGYDWECRFQNLPDSEGKLQFLKILIPASFATKSNVPGHEKAECKLHEDPAELAKQFIDGLKATAETSYEIMKEKYADIIQQIEEKQGDVKALHEKVKSAEAVVALVCEELQNEIEQRQAQGLKDDEEEQKLKKKIDDVKNCKDLETAWRHYRQAKVYTRLQSDLDAWMKRLPVCGFNSGKFDLNLIKEYLIPYFLKTYSPGTVKAIKRGQQFMSLASPELQFLDISCYLGPGISYEKFIKAYGIKASKGFWPYEWFVDFKQLDEGLPPRSAFYSILKQREMSEEEYAEVKRIWDEHKFTNMRQMLEWYNILDVGPLLEGINRMFDNFKTMLSLDIFKQAISLPGLALLHLFDDQKPADFFQLFCKNLKHWDDIVRQNIVGGPSIIFHRRHIALQTRLRHKLGKLVKTVLGYDANALYLWCTGQRMPVGLAVAYEAKVKEGHAVPTVEGTESVARVKQMIQDNMRIKFSRRQTDRCKLELDYVMWKLAELKKEYRRDDLTVMHKYNGGQMKFVKGKRDIYVDGYVPELNTILQFHGCRWHGCDCQVGKMDEEKRLEKREKTQQISDFLKTTGKETIEEWQCEFKRRPGVKEYIASTQLSGRSGMTAAQILNMVRNEQIFGMVQVDLQVPWWIDGMREHMDEMAPIFKNIQMGRDDLNDEMREIAIDNGIMATPRRTLINSFHGQELLVATPLLKWYLDQGLVVTRVHRCLQFRGERVFQKLADEVTTHRSAADRDPNQKVLADMYKLLGNSYYGKCLTNKLKQNNRDFMTEDNAHRAVNDPLFQGLDEVSDDCYEVLFKKKKIKFDLPVLVAYFVYSYAKMRMLSFYYQFLDKVLKREDFELCEMDTDSLYFACSAETLEGAIAPERRSIYEQLKREFLALDPDPQSPSYDMRTPGLFKMEWSGSAIISLSSKTYVCFDDETKAQKLSTKGLSKRTNPHLNPGTFKDILDNKTTEDGTNYGFRRYGRKMALYKQQRTGLSYFYAKRNVIDDDRTTSLVICEFISYVF